MGKDISTDALRASSESLAVVLPARWQTMRSAPASGARNMAVDAALLEHARTSECGVWRCYAWRTPTVSFGRNELTRGRFSATSVAAAGLDAVRRPTGGRALLHAREVTYSVTFPLSPSVSWRTAYAAVNAILLRGLTWLGVAAQLADDATAPIRPDGPLCFDAPAAGEIVVDGAKLAGSAVWRERGAYLQHGSILLHDDQPMLRNAACVSLADLPAAASLASCCTTVPSWTQVVDALESALAQYAAATPFDEPVGFSSLVDAHERAMMRADWLWRR